VVGVVLVVAVDVVRPVVVWRTVAGVSVLLGFGCNRVTGTATESRETT
jgi:hypothetical protein